MTLHRRSAYNTRGLSMSNETQHDVPATHTPVWHTPGAEAHAFFCGSNSSSTRHTKHRLTAYTSHNALTSGAHLRETPIFSSTLHGCCHAPFVTTPRGDGEGRAGWAWGGEEPWLSQRSTHLRGLQAGVDHHPRECAAAESMMTPTATAVARLVRLIMG